MKKNIELVARNLKLKYKTNDPFLICQKLNIDVSFTELGNIKGFFRKCLNRKMIMLNESLDGFSARFVLAHELGHAILHNSDEISFMKQNFFHYSDSIEKEANKFALELLFKNDDEENYDAVYNCELSAFFLKLISENI